VPIHGALWFVDADLPTLGRLKFDGFVLANPKRLSARIGACGPVTDASVRVIATYRADRPPAR